jgi:oxygen-independent coproporphyrinogen-3 oxidase
MAKASRNLTLRRNFQGYTTDTSEYLIGLGASSIGKTPDGYVQNTHATATYMRQVENGELPILRGLGISPTDKMHAAVIEQLMCYFEIGFDWLEKKYGQQSGDGVDRGAEKIHAIARQLVADNEDGYFIETKDGYAITDEGKPFTRQFASHFDEYLNQGAARYSVAV